MVDTLNNEINYLRGQMQTEKDQFENKFTNIHQSDNSEVQNKLTDQIEQIQNLLFSMNQVKTNIQTQLDEIQEQSKEQLQNLKTQNEQMKEQIEEQKSIILSLKQEKEEIKNKNDTKIDNINTNTTEILKLLEENYQDSKIDDIKNDTIEKPELFEIECQTENENLSQQEDTIENPELFEIECQTENENLSQQEDTIEKPELIEVDSQTENENLSQQEDTKNSDKATEEEEILDPTKENEKLVQIKRKEILDELIEILKIEEDSNIKDENLEDAYDNVINKVKEMTEKINNVSNTENQNLSENSDIEQYQIKIQDLKNNNNDLQNKIMEMDSTIAKMKDNYTHLKQQKESSDDLLRRHISIIQIENDKQLRRVKYLQKQELNAILNHQNSAKNKNDKSDNESYDDDSESD